MKLLLDGVIVLLLLISFFIFLFVFLYASGATIVKAPANKAKRLKDVEKELEYFLESISCLEEKILALLIQLPPSLRIAEGM